MNPNLATGLATEDIGFTPGVSLNGSTSHHFQAHDMWVLDEWMSTGSLRFGWKAEWMDGWTDGCLDGWFRL